MKQVFGPVPSRRLGQSLGIDPVPLKTCNWNCVYCQLGRTKPITNDRKDFFPPDEIISQTREILNNHKPGDIDWVTFIGSGETTLCASLGDLVKEVKNLTPLPIAVITNGSLLYQPEVREALSPADAVMPTFDAGNPALYRKLNRPHPDITFDRMVSGLRAFREIYTGNLWVEVMLVRGVNDSEEALYEIAKILKDIRADEIHIMQPTRPPSELWVHPPDLEGLQRARTILGDNARIIEPAEGLFDLSGEENLLDAVISIITRHPMRESVLVETLAFWSREAITETLDELHQSGKVQIINRLGDRFLSASPAFYPSEK